MRSVRVWNAAPAPIVIENRQRRDQKPLELSNPSTSVTEPCIDPVKRPEAVQKHSYQNTSNPDGNHIAEANNNGRASK